MVRAGLVILSFAASSLVAQSRIDLLQQVASHYSDADSFRVTGTASSLIPGTSWRVSYEFVTEGAQPSFLPLNVRQNSPRVISSVFKMTETLAVPAGTDPKPHGGFALAPMGRYNAIATRLISAQKIGAESIVVDGQQHRCEIIDATYDYSPSFKPKSVTVHKHFWIDPAEKVVLKETQPIVDRPDSDWTGQVTSFSFNQPPSEMMVTSLKRFDTQPKERQDWVGRPAPDLTLQELYGPPINLASLRGKPILLDFWGSYCGPCKRATLHAQELQSRFASDLIVLSLTQDTADDARGWAEYNHVKLPIVLDRDGTAFKAFDVQGVPEAILIGTDGKISHYWVGFSDPAAMDATMAESLRASSSPTAAK